MLSINWKSEAVSPSSFSTDPDIGESWSLDIKSGHSVWVPGAGCPVPTCPLRSEVGKLRSVTNFRKHWRTRHEATVMRYRCHLCPASSKRRNDLYSHYLVKHRYADKSKVIASGQQPNRQFIDPYPLTLEDVLKQVWCHCCLLGGWLSSSLIIFLTMKPYAANSQCYQLIVIVTEHDFAQVRVYLTSFLPRRAYRPLWRAFYTTFPGLPIVLKSLWQSRILWIPSPCP